MKKFMSVVVIALAALSTGCSQRVADLTVASTKNINLDNGKFEYGNRVTGTDQRGILFGIPVGIPEVKTAADRAIEQDRCAVGLKDVVVDYSFFSFFFGFMQYDVTGNLIIDKNVPGCTEWKYKAPDFVEEKKQVYSPIGNRHRSGGDLDV
ncbi:hypothetical protein OPFAMLBM_00288 [Aeromonas phage avDM12-TAAL]|nr:hypothetical protein OPFAMLBM_00288 [Aeromonas phage avDM12-TAAL]